MKKRSPWEIQKAVVFALMMRELKTRLGGRWIGFFWLLSIPLAETSMLLFVNEQIRGRLSRAGYDYMIYALVGLIPYQTFRGLWNQLAKAIKANKGLFGYRQVKPMDTFIARTIMELAIHMLILTIILVMFSRIGKSPTVPVDPLAYLSIVFLFTALGAGLGIIQAILVQIMPKLDTFVTILTMPLMILSGVVFQFWNLPPQFYSMLLYNPLFHMADAIRGTFLPGYKVQEGINLMFPIKVTVIVWFFAMLLYGLRKQHLISK